MALVIGACVALGSAWSVHEWPTRDWPKRALRYSKAPPTAKLVLIALAFEGDCYGVTSSTKARLAELTGLSVRAIAYALADLIALGELKVLSRAGGRGQPAQYKIVLKRVQNTKPL